MFQLIVAVISIALVAALAIASIYYGGQAFERSGAKAASDTLLNGAQQISGAEALYRTDNGGTDSTDLAFADLLKDGPNGKYLSSLPAMPSGVTGTWAFAAGTTDSSGNVSGAAATVSGVPTQVCTAMMQGSTGVSAYSCTGTAFSFTL